VEINSQEKKGGEKPSQLRNQQKKKRRKNTFKCGTGFEKPHQGEGRPVGGNLPKKKRARVHKSFRTTTAHRARKNHRGKKIASLN